MIRKIIGSLFIGVLVTIFFAQHDEWVKNKVGSAFKNAFEKALNCNISFQVKEIGFLFPYMILEDVIVTPSDDSDWSWSCKSYHSSFTWGNLLSMGAIDMRLIISDLAVQSGIIDGQLTILPHIRKLLEGPALQIPLFLKAVRMDRATCSLVNEKENAQFDLSWNSSSLRIDNKFKTSMYINDMCMNVKNTCYIQSGSGSIHINATKSEKDDFSGNVHVNTSCIIPQLGPNDACFITGIWNDKYGRFSIRSVRNTIMIDPIIISERKEKKHISISGYFPLSLATEFMHTSDAHMINGDCSISLQATFDEPYIAEGHVTLEDVIFHNTPLCDAAKCSFSLRNNKWQGALALRGYKSELSGFWAWHNKNNAGNLQITNNRTLRIPRTTYWHVLPRNLSVCVTTDDTKGMQLHYNCNVTNTIEQKAYDSEGDLFLYNDTFNIRGGIHGRRYAADGVLRPTIQLHSCQLQSQDDIKLINLIGTYEDQTKLAGTLDYRFIRSIIKHILGYDLQGEGAVNARGVISGEHVTLDLSLDDATIRLPQTYNFIDRFTLALDYDVQKHQVTVDHLHCSLHTGTVTSPRIVALFDGNGRCTFAHVPLQLDHCLLNVKKDLFAVISAHVLLKHNINTESTVQGNVFLDRAQLKENLFSTDFQKKISSYAGNMFSVPGTELGCDLTLETKTPIRVDTTFLQTNAKIGLHAKGPIKEPIITGSVQLIGGVLQFPYKPLHIVKGGLSFMSDKPYDPLIELVARNTMKKYNLTLHVTGSISSHHVMLDATPPLKDEQIIALLLVGSEQESLNAMMPAIIMQNLKQVIFGSNQLSLFQEYFNPLLKPFNIHLVPSFTDQTGRGGLRGTLEIDVNDRWRALIQKNFSLTEDTRFELEYLLSDDISLRAIRDERRDIGGEVEVRWKF